MTGADSLMLRIFLLLFLSGFVALIVYSRSEEEDKNRDAKYRYAPFIAPFMLPLVICTLLVCSPIFDGWERTGELMLSLLVPVALSVALNCALLLLLLPLLRRRFRARTCACLWLLPNLLYVTINSILLPNAPMLVLRLKPETARILLLVWAAGFAGVLLWKILSHLHFRKKLLRAARDVTDGEALELWKSTQLSLKFRKPKYRLMVSGEISSPLSVGLFGWSLRVVLPDVSYTSDELELIFRHELIHIQRQDCWAKFFLVFCTALNWFNPLLWIAMRRTAEDLELSCDESVLEELPDEARRRYAELILRSAGDSRGFTTCLSASAAALRYRLKNILQPGPRLSGALIAGALVFVMFFSFGYVALASGGDTAGETLLTPCGITAESQPTSVTRAQGRSFRSVTCTDETAVMDYIASLPVYTITGAYDWDTDEENGLYLTFGRDTLTLQDHRLYLTDLHKSADAKKVYYVLGEIDWAYLDSLLKSKYDEMRTDPPSLILDFGENGPQTEGFLYAETTLLSKTVDGVWQDLSPQPEPDAPCVISGCDVTEVSLGFPVMPTAYSVRAVALDGSQSKYVTGQTVSDNDYKLDLVPFSARYTVTAAFTVDDGVTETVYKMKYCFDVELPE